MSALLEKHNIVCNNQSVAVLTMHSPKNALLQTLFILIFNSIDAISTLHKEGGLYIASRLVENYLDWKISVQNITNGACFRISVAQELHDSLAQREKG